MRKYFRVVAWCAMLMVLFPGCGSNNTAKPKQSVPLEVSNKPQSVDELKTRLNEMIKTGLAGSATAGMKEKFEESEYEQADALAKMVPELEKANDKSEVRAIARRMLAMMKSGE